MDEATGGHAVYKHTVPGLEPSVMITSHDVDAPDSHNDGVVWGRAGAIQMLDMEMEEGAPASWFIQTDYKRGFFNATTIGTIAAAGMTSMGGHSNLHLPWEEMQLGDCSVVQSNYDIDAPTVCGEIDVNLALVRQAAPQATGDIWRSPLLSLSPFQYPVLAAQGVKYDSTLALGDVKGNFPIIGERSGRFASLFQGARIVTIPVQAEDGMGFFDASGVQRRVEIQRTTFRRMLLGWTTLLEENTANGAGDRGSPVPQPVVQFSVTQDCMQARVPAAPRQPQKPPAPQVASEVQVTPRPVARPNCEQLLAQETVPKQSGSPQSKRSLALSSKPLLQSSPPTGSQAGAAAQAGSLQSTRPLPLLSRPSVQFSTQEATAAQSLSAQSVRPSPSLSRPSVQFSRQTERPEQSLSRQSA
jgi:hypothetical protein